MEKLTLKKRWKSKTPDFWKNIQKIGLTVGSIGAILIAPPIGLSLIGGYLITAGSIVGVLSQLTVQDNGENK